jgi:hypothetical protein
MVATACNSFGKPLADLIPSGIRFFVGLMLVHMTAVYTGTFVVA